MKSVRFAEFGGPDVLRLVDAEEPHPGPGQARIAVRAAGVNPVDWRIREGQILGAHPVELPAGVGQDAAGVVDEVGAGVDGVEVGDHVFGEGSSTYAEYAVMSAWAHMPAGLAFAEAAGYPSVVETALRIIREVGVRPGQTLLVSGASGGVGSAVLQIARERGITTIGTAGASNQDYLRSLGAQATTYGEGWVERVRQLGRIDAALDLAGSGVIRELVELTGDPGKVISIADLSAAALGVRFSGVAGSMSAALTEAADLISRGKLHIPVEKSYELAEAAQAHIDSHAGHTRGRRVILVQTDPRGLQRRRRKVPATLKVTHKTIGAEVRRGTYDIMVDGARAGSVELNGTFETSIQPGHHTLQIRNGRNSSRTAAFDADEDQVIAFRCGGKNILPIFLLSFIVPSLAISLRRE